MAASVFREITLQLAAYERHGYDLDAIHRLPDTFCMGWHTSPVSAEFACNLAREVATRSMREQLSFDYARPAALNISWWSFVPHDSVYIARGARTGRCVT